MRKINVSVRVFIQSLSVRKFNSFLKNASVLTGLVSGFLLLATSLTLQAQVDTGTIQGTVSDSGGARIVHAAVTVTNEGTGLVQTESVNGSGLFTFSPMRVGLYTVSAKAPGFGVIQREHLKLNVQQTLVVDLSLKVGKTSESVVVTTAAPLLQTQDASVGQVFESHEINALPLNGRNFTLLAQLEAGVTTTVVETRGLGLSGSFVANGTMSQFNNYLLDGIENNNTTVDFGNGNAFTVLPPPDAIDQFKIQTTNYSAEFGRGGGAVVNAVLKSGQNRFYGDVWDYLRNDVFDANDWFLDHAKKPKPAFRRNQFGATLGGPIWRDKTFFFVDYQGTRSAQGVAYVSSVPTALERSSGYTDYTDLIANQKGTQTDQLGRVTPIGTVFDPATTRPTTAGQVDPVTGLVAKGNGSVRDPFAGNIVPLNRLSPIAAKLLNLFPAPNNGTNINSNYISTPSLTNNLDAFDARIDQNFSARDQAFARGSYSNNPRVVPAPMPGYAIGAQSSQSGSETDKVLSLALGETHVFSPHMVNEFRVGYSRIHSPREQFFANQSGLNAKFGIPGVAFDNAPNGGLVQIKIAGLSELGTHNNIPQNEIGAETQYNDNVTMDKGRHTIRFGAEYERLKTSIYSAQFPHSNWNFGGSFTDVPAGNTANTGIAQFAIEPIASTVPTGFPFIGGAQQIQTSPLSQEDYRKPYCGAYAEDTWRATSTLTITAGLRYEFFELAQDHAGRGGNFVPADGKNSAQFLIDDRHKNIPLSPTFLSLLAKDNIQLVYTANHQMGTLPTLNLAPRIGFAWQTSPKIVFRGGYGIFYAGVYNRGDGTNIGNAYPFAYTANITSTSLTNGALSTDGSVGPLDKGFLNAPVGSDVVAGSTVALRGLQYHSHVPYVQGVNFTMQAQLTPSIAYTVGYVATFARHAEGNIGSNRPHIVVPSNVALTQRVGGVIQPHTNDCTVAVGGTVSQTSAGAPCSLLPYPDFPQNNTYVYMEGNDAYNSLQATIQKVFSHGAGFLANYTWSKALGDGSDPGIFTQISYRGPYVPGFGMRGDKQLETFNIAHLFHVSATYDLPFGAGREHLNHPGVLDAIVGGWSLDGIFTFQSGQPFTVNGTKSSNNGSGNYAYVDTSKLYTGAHTVTHWANAAAFSNPATAQGPTDISAYGGSPAQGVGPHFHRDDLGIAKKWHTPLSTILEFHAEAFNVTNTPEFAQPGTLSPNSSNFASITSTRNSPNDSRQIQFGVKLIFGPSL